MRHSNVCRDRRGARPYRLRPAAEAESAHWIRCLAGRRLLPDTLRMATIRRAAMILVVLLLVASFVLPLFVSIAQ